MNLCADKFDAQTHAIADYDDRQHGQQAEQEHREPAGLGLTDGQIVLVTDVVHAEQQGRYQGHHNRDHGALQVIAIVDVGAQPRCGVGCEQESLHAVIDRL